MENKRDERYALCFRCAAIFTYEEKDKMICNSCGFEIESALYERIYNYANALVLYGYNYKKKYEEQFNETGKITKVFCILDPPTILSFAGIAAISGIIGGISYDVVKKIIQKIMVKSKEIIDDLGQDKIALTDDYEIKIFIQYLVEYQSNEINAPEVVQFHIRKEKLINDLSDIVFEERNNNKIDDERINRKKEEILSKFKILLNSYPVQKNKIHDKIDQLSQKSKNGLIDEEEPSIENFIGFWDDIEE